MVIGLADDIVIGKNLKLSRPRAHKCLQHRETILFLPVLLWSMQTHHDTTDEDDAAALIGIMTPKDRHHFMDSAIGYLVHSVGTADEDVMGGEKWGRQVQLEKQNM